MISFHPLHPGQSKIKAALHSFRGLANTPETRSAVVAKLNTIGFKRVICDEANNPPPVVEANRLVITVLDGLYSATFTLTPTGFNVKRYDPSSTVKVRQEKDGSFQGAPALSFNKGPAWIPGGAEQSVGRVTAPRGISEPIEEWDGITLVDERPNSHALTPREISEPHLIWDSVTNPPSATDSPTAEGCGVADPE